MTEAHSVSLRQTLRVMRVIQLNCVSFCWRPGPEWARGWHPLRPPGSCASSQRGPLWWAPRSRGRGNASPPSNLCGCQAAGANSNNSSSVSCVLFKRGGLSRRKRGKWAACWARAREKGPVVARLTPPLSLRACARSSPADRGLLFQGLSRRPRAAPAGGIKGCSAGLPQTPSVPRGRWTPGRVSSRRPPAHTCAPSAPLSPSRSLVKGLSVLETSAERKFRRPGVESADDCVSIPREPCKEENLVYNRGKKRTACFSVQERKSLCFTRDGTLSKLSELTVVSSGDPSLRRKTQTKANYSLGEPSETFLQTSPWLSLQMLRRYRICVEEN